MNLRKATAITLVVLAVIGGWIITRVDSISRIPGKAPMIAPSDPPAPPVAVDAAPPRPEETPPALQELPPAMPQSRSEESRAADKRDFMNPLVPTDPPGTPSYRRAANAGPEVVEDFDKIYRMLRDFRGLTGGNPVGTNAEIMAAIMGDNPKGARLGPPEGQSLNGNGELIDRWGTPYFFHQLTSDVMEIHSAGPDRRMWNEDDIVSD